MQVVYSPQCLGFMSPGHPESPDRVRIIHDELRASGFRFVAAEPATEKDALLVHTREHLERLRKGAGADAETPRIDIKYPLLAAGVTIKAAQIRGFALTRPPGHHAGPDKQEGFCYLNNVAIAVRKLGKRTAILDLDVHHGNGTQDIFLGDGSVMYSSIHQVPLYPNTGLKSERNCYNYPVFRGTDDKSYLRTLEKALVVVSAFRPELLAVSIGFDTYGHDPLGGLKLTEKCYGEIGRMVKALGIETFIALEGGYSKDIGKLCLSFLKGF